MIQASSPSSLPESDDEVLISQVGDKGVLTLNRPKVLNALNVSMIRQMTAQLQVNFICSYQSTLFMLHVAYCSVCGTYCVSFAYHLLAIFR